MKTLRWLTSIDDSLHTKLVALGLAMPRDRPESLTLGEHLANYMARRTDAKASTLANWSQARLALETFFDSRRTLDSISNGDARDFERWLRTPAARSNRYSDRDKSTGLAPTTARKRVSIAKQFFEDAVQRDLLARNPFAGLNGSVGSNRERDFFVSREAASKVLDACPDRQWQLLFALCRYAGLRCPSEVLNLQWCDVNWSENRMLVRSPKTEHHDGKGSRVIPIFSVLRPILNQAWEAAEPGSNYVITRYRGQSTNLRTQLKRIITKAGLQPWPKLFANLRASCATELAAEHPAHVAAAWLGHSTVVATKHYWQVTEDDFHRATGQAAQNPAQSVHESERTSLQEEKDGTEQTLKKQGSAAQAQTPASGTDAPSRTRR